MPQILSALILVAVSVPPAFAQTRAMPIYIKVHLEGMAARPYEKSGTLPQVQQQIAQMVSERIINGELNLEYPWEFRPAPLDGEQYPQLTIKVFDKMIGSDIDNWNMSLHFVEGPRRRDNKKDFKTENLLPQGEIGRGTAPDPNQRKQLIYVWFHQHFAANDQCSLKQELRKRVPLAKGYVQPKATDPAIAPGTGVVLLREEFYGKLEKLRCKWQCGPDDEWEWEAEGTGRFTRVTLSHGLEEGIVVRHIPPLPQGVDFDTLGEGKIYFISSEGKANGTF